MKPAKKQATTTTIVIQTKDATRPAFQASLVGLAGNVFGSRFLLAKDRVLLGRDPAQADITIDDSGVSRVHAEIVRSEVGHVLRDLGSKNGTLLDGETVGETVLEDGQQVSIGKSVLKYLRLNVIELQYHDKMTRLSKTDELTGLNNRRHAWEVLGTELARAARHGRPLSVVLFDVDHFKRVNDTHGHAVGDACLVEIARRVCDVVRRVDLVARIGGEEFLVVLPDSDILEAAELATRIRDAVAQTPIVEANVEVPVTVSLGVADLQELQLTHGAGSNGDEKAVELFVALADAKLYEAKHLGRNRVAV